MADVALATDAELFITNPVLLTTSSSRTAVVIKKHVCVPIEYDEQIINILCCHPTPPVFDGEERRNAKRNHDELRLLVDIIDGADYLVSDQRRTSGINLQQPFVIMGSQCRSYRW